MATPRSDTSMMAPDLDAFLLLESPFARTPYEDLRRRLRSHQRIIEREFAALNAATIGKSTDKDDALRRVDALIERVRGIKHKLDPLADDFESSVNRLKTRTHHLDQVHDIVGSLGSHRGEVKADNHASRISDGYEAMEETEDALASSRANHLAYQSWSDIRLQRMITDWLLRRGYVEAAEKFVNSRDIESLTDLSVFKELFAIRASLVPSSKDPQQPRTCALALSWCLDNKVALRRIKSTLEFDLRVQEFIDLCRIRTADSLSSAIAYARRHLLPVYRTALEALNAEDPASITAPDEDGLQEAALQARVSNERVVQTVSRALGLLAVGPGGMAYEDLYSHTRYTKLYDTLLSAALNIYSLPPQPLLHIALSAGLSSLKVPACYRGQRPAAGTSAIPSLAVNNKPLLPETSIPSSPATSASSGYDHDLYMQAKRESELRGERDTSAIVETARSKTKRRIQDEMKNDNCPICSVVNLQGGSNSSSSTSRPSSSHAQLGLGILAKEVPWSHHSNSTIVCRITGKIIDDSEEGGEGAVVLPNGRVYSQKALRSSETQQGEAAVAPDKVVVCPRTGMTFPRTQIKRVYIT